MLANLLASMTHKPRKATAHNQVSRVKVAAPVDEPLEIANANTGIHETSSIAMPSDAASDGGAETVAMMNDAASIAAKTLQSMRDHGTSKPNESTDTEFTKTHSVEPQAPRKSPRKRPVKEAERATKRPRVSWDVLEPVTNRSQRQNERRAEAEQEVGLGERRLLRNKKVTSRDSRRPGDMEMSDTDDRRGPEPVMNGHKTSDGGKKRNLAKKPVNPSPMKGRAQVPTDNPNVNLEDGSPAPGPRRSQRQRRARGASEGAIPTQQSHDQDGQTAKPSTQAASNEPELPLQRLSNPRKQSAQTRDRESSSQPQSRQRPQNTESGDRELPTQPGSEQRQESSEDDDAGSQHDSEGEKRKTKRLREEAKQGIENAMKLLNCERAWTDMVVAGLRLSEDIPPKPESVKGQKACKIIKKIRNLFRSDRSQSDLDMYDLSKSFERHQRDYDQLLKEFEPKMIDGSHERVKEARDLHLHIIPRLVQACKAVLRLLFEGVGPEYLAWDIISSMLHLTVLTVGTAQEWQPRPTTLDTGVLQLVRNEVMKNVRVIHGAFSDQAYTRRSLRNEEELRVGLAKVQKRANETFHNNLWAQRMERLARMRQPVRQSVQEPPREPLVEMSVVDINNLNLADAQHSDSSAAGPSNAGPARVNGLAIGRMPVKAASRVWSDIETRALVAALERHTEEDRFLQILDARPPELEDISLDDLVEKARECKRRIMADPYGCKAPEFGFLRSVSD